MKRVVAVVAAVVVVVATALGLPLGTAVLFMAASSDSPAQECAPNSSVAGGIEVSGANGAGRFTLDADQVGYVATLTSVAAELNVPRPGLVIAVMVGLQESSLSNLANSNVPESLELEHDGVGSDHDSVGIVQQRANWGSVAERLDVAYAWRAFYGGPEGPNGGTPAGLLDIDGWEALSPGEAAQTVQVSAYPDAYDKWETTATEILAALTGSCSSTPPAASADGWVTPTTGVVGDGFGPRGLICSGGICTPGSHSGVDIIAPAGTPIVAAAAGTVTYAEEQRRGGWVIMITHGDGVMTVYGHMLPNSFQVGVDDVVEPGQVIGLMGATGLVTGVHLHYSVYLDGTPIDPVPFMLERGVRLG